MTPRKILRAEKMARNDLLDKSFILDIIFRIFYVKNLTSIKYIPDKYFSKLFVLPTVNKYAEFYLGTRSFIVLAPILFQERESIDLLL